MASHMEERTFLAIRGPRNFVYNPRNGNFRMTSPRDLNDSSEGEDQRVTPCTTLRPPLPGLYLTTDDVPKYSQLRFHFGRSEHCDIFLGGGNERATSGKHFAIQVNPTSQDLILVNSSSDGTAVSFDNEKSFIALKFEKVIEPDSCFVCYPARRPRMVLFSFFEALKSRTLD
ncbi:hypothetical protein BKA56DRAFT_652352 [Ilyonectria sp. MPI-CAGE-AT-0026]|nr:hypothetical protein BKA56DRAFT_652352 [Ilyonectria sp. MPI-CAGE-AT-0026]